MEAVVMKKYTKLILSQLSERWAMIFLILVEIYASTLIFSVVWQDVARYLDALHLYDILSVDRMVLVSYENEEGGDPGQSILAQQVLEKVDGLTNYGFGDSGFYIMPKEHQYADRNTDYSLNRFPESFFPLLHKIPLAEGKWFEAGETYGDNVVGIVVPYAMKDKFQVGKEYALRGYCTENDSRLMGITVYVYGVLKNDIVYTGGLTIDYNPRCFYTYDADGYLEAISPIFGGRSVMEVSSEQSYEETLEKIKEIDRSVKDTQNTLDSLKSSIIFPINLSILIFLAISIAAVTGFVSYNLLSVYDNRKNCAVWYLCGATWGQSVRLLLAKNIPILLIPLLGVAITLLYLGHDRRIFSGFWIMTGLLLIIFLVSTGAGMLRQRKVSPSDEIRKWL